MSLKKRLLAVTSAIAITLALGTTASAEVSDSKTNDVDITVLGGELTLDTSDIDSFGEIELTETAQNYSTSFSNNFTVKDLRGTQAGWNLNLSASQFENERNETLPTGSLTLGGDVSIERVGDGAGDTATSDLVGTTIIDEGSTSIATAEEETGMGVISIGFDEDALTLTVDPTTAKTGNYTSTLTWNLESTPQ